jgi:hypothetical protein
VVASRRLRPPTKYLVRSLKVSDRLVFVDPNDGIGHRVDQRKKVHGHIVIVNLTCEPYRNYHNITDNPLQRDTPVTCMTCLVIGHKN